MNQLTTLTDDADQLVYYALPDGTVATIQFTYRPAIQRWSMSLTYSDIVLNGYMLCASPNLLRQWMNLIPLGMAVVSADGQDPVAIDDFTTGRIQIFMLTVAEVQQVETQVIGALT